MHLLDLLSPGRVVAPGPIPGKKRLLEKASGLLAEGNAELERAVFDSLVGRERLGSTGLGHGVAIPHGRSAKVSTAVGTFLRLGEPVDFGAPDGQPVLLVETREWFRQRLLPLLGIVVLRDLIAHLGGNDFWRLRLGIGQRQPAGLGPERIGRGHRLARLQLGPGQPTLLVAIGDQAEDAHRLGLQQLAQGRDQGDIHHIPVAKPGQFGKMIYDFRHGAQ